MAANVQWAWSEPHQDSYYVATDVYGRTTFHWYKDIYGATSQRVRADSGSHDYGSGHFSSLVSASAAYQASSGNDAASTVAQMPEQVPFPLRSTLQNFIPGTPERGWYEMLDSSYRVRTGGEARQFFKKGRVFSMLYSEAASESAARDNDNDSVTVVKFGGAVFSQIRRFVVVSVRHGFVYACGISTYGRRGTLKPGCIPAEHAIVYFTGSVPVPLYQETGMTKEPIEICPADYSQTMEHTSRLRFGKTFSIEWNVKVKDIGTVIPDHMPKMLSYWQEGFFDDH